jgi:sodium/potassium-transporting ATPase subunit alpha
LVNAKMAQSPKCPSTQLINMPFPSLKARDQITTMSHTSREPLKKFGNSAQECLLNEGKYKPIDADEKKRFEAVNLRFGKNGERVLGFAMLPLNKEIYHQDYGFVTSTPDNFNFPMENFIFVGLISLMDPPKESVPYAIKKCQSAGIKVIMVTGDQPPTAAAIAKQIGIITMKTN